ncbi:sensor histidine kinase [Tundrisphaera lichenicola]|uniref:sensor histidine kinase n=1 Tax=Tundrisphaera lichenicola TaxID=2029860 RepID=UPI003EC01B02
MIDWQKIGAIPGRLHAVLGAPGVIIGCLSVLSFGFGLVVLTDEYHHPTRIGRDALHQLIGGWLHVDDYLGYTLVDHADSWLAASPEERPRALGLLRRSLSELGGGLSDRNAEIRLIRVEGLELGPRGGPPLASWKPESGPVGGGEVGTDTVEVTGAASQGPPLELSVRYRVVPEVSAALGAVEISYHRLLLALVGLSGYSLLCLGYMVLHARSQGDRIAREAAAAATLDLADRTCHELGNVAFVVANERRNLASHIELLERFVAEDAEAHAGAARKAGLEPSTARRFEAALRREYADRGIDPEFELKGSATIARDVCRQIAVCSDYIALTVRELDGYLKQSSMSVDLAPLPLEQCLDDALALMAPRLEATGARIERLDPVESPPRVLADRRLLIHALVNLIKNAMEAASLVESPPVIRVGVGVEGATGWLTVADNGPGIEPEMLRRVFEARYSTKGAGRGLGLAIVRESIAAQGGTIELESQPGSGTLFRIRLPIFRPA